MTMTEPDWYLIRLIDSNLDVRIVDGIFANSTRDALRFALRRHFFRASEEMQASRCHTEGQRNRAKFARQHSDLIFEFLRATSK